MRSAALPAGAADEKPAREKGKFGDRLTNLAQLLPQEAVDKLKLTDEQKEKLAAIQKDFASKSKEAFEKSRDAMKKAFEDGDKDAGKKAIEDMRSAAEKARSEALDKVAGILKDDQKKVFDEIKKDLPKPGEFRPGNRPEATPPERRPGIGGGAAAPTQLLPERLKDDLKLTDEQKEKLAKLQKETEAKLMELLTDEQKKKLEELKKDGPPRRRPSQQ